jgi:hypothetical protein
MMPTAPPPPKTCGSALDTTYISVLTPAMVQGKYVLDANKIYLLQASGTAPTGAAGLGDGDAEYMDFGANETVNGYNDGEACADFGLGVDELMPMHCSTNSMCIHRKNWWATVGIAGNRGQYSPTYRNDHVYYMVYPGTGKPVTYVYFDSGYGDNKDYDVLSIVYPMP